MPFISKGKQRALRIRSGVTAAKAANAKASKALREVKKLSQANEQHYRDDEKQYTAGTGVDHWTAIQTGDGPTDRTGNAINVNSIQCQGFVDYTYSVAGTPSLPQSIHMAIVQDKQQVSDSDPTYNDVFDTVLVGTAQGLIKIRRNIHNLKRFSVIWDKLITVGNVGGLKQREYFSFNKKYKAAKQVLYNGNSSADIQRNGIYFVYYSDDQVTPIGGRVTARVRFDP